MGKTLSKPWRPLPAKNQDTRDFVKSYKPHNEKANQLRILLLGPVGVGKSSFINSVDSVLQGRVTGRVMTDASSTKSFTKKFRTCKFTKDQSHCLFVFNDIMGIEETTGGIHLQDIKLALKGHVKDDYEFIPGHPLKEEDLYYNSYPSVNDRVHVLVTVVKADLMSLLSKDTLEKLRVVRLEASAMGIPQFAVLTHVDEACPTVNKDKMNIYKSKYLKERVQKFSKLVGIPVNCIFLVKNYSSEIKTDDATDAHILCALKQMIDFGEDFLNHLNDRT